MRTPKEFDYDLWTTKENRCMVRVKATGEECEVSREIFRLLRAEEERLKKEHKGRNQENFLEGKNCTTLSLDIVPEDESTDSAWLIDSRDFTEEIVTSQVILLFQQRLTKRQLDVFEKCLLGGMNLQEYARTQRLNYRAVWEVREAIRKKFTKF